MSQLSYKQIESVQKGRIKRQRMIQMISNITQFDQVEKYSNLYIYSPPGLGKSHTVKEFLEETDLNYINVSGNTSLFALGIQLAVTSYMSQDRPPIIVHVDDCDEIFKNEQNCNTMKKVLDFDKVFVYEKSLSSQWNNLSELQRDAINYFSTEGQMGFVVPTDNMRFIFTSNFQLPIDDEVAEARKKGKSKAILMSHRNAIRSRCKVGDFSLTGDEHWGWIADVVMNTNIFSEMNLSDEDKVNILDYLYYNWGSLTERSIRLVEKMAHVMRLYPENYKNVWDIDYLRVN
jgi:hypothetical protein